MDFTAYQYDDNGIYLGEVDCQRCPKRNIPLTPKNSTKVKPPVVKNNELAIFILDSQEWIVSIKKEDRAIDSIEESINLLKNPTKESIKKAINLLINLL